MPDVRYETFVCSPVRVATITALTPAFAHFARSLFARRLTVGLFCFALVMHLMAMQIGNLHQAARLLAGATDTLVAAQLHQVCTSNGLVSLENSDSALGSNTDSEQPAEGTGNSHHFEKPCPFCSSASVTPLLLAVAVSFFLPPEPVSTAAQDHLSTPQPRAPDLRHAPLRAPPVIA